MNDYCSHNSCHDCPGRTVCRCLQITEGELVTAITALELRTVNEVRQHTGAGDGCTACHRLLHQYLEQHACRAVAELKVAG